MLEIEGTEPYIVGGHTASGYWVDTNERLLLTDFMQQVMLQVVVLKYVTGALAEGEIWRTFCS